jgi:hypothetical protein
VLYAFFAHSAKLLLERLFLYKMPWLDIFDRFKMGREGGILLLASYLLILFTKNEGIWGIALTNFFNILSPAFFWVGSP